LAGLPQVVVERAVVVLDARDTGDREGGGSRKAVIDDLPLFSATPTAAPAIAKASQVEQRLKGVLPDELSPKDALALIYELRELASRD
jgi:DNA mismatch repair protein MutS